MSRGQLLERLQSGPCVLLLATSERGHPWAVVVAGQHQLQQTVTLSMHHLFVIGGTCAHVSLTHDN